MGQRGLLSRSRRASSDVIPGLWPGSTVPFVLDESLSQGRNCFCSCACSADLGSTMFQNDRNIVVEKADMIQLLFLARWTTVCIQFSSTQSWTWIFRFINYLSFFCAVGGRSLRHHLLRAMMLWSRETEIFFIPRTDQVDYVRITWGER